MTVAITNTGRIMRKRFGAYMKERREEIGLTQLDVAALVDYGYPAMVSQIERGGSSLPPHDLRLWAEVLRLEPATLAQKWLYFNEPDVYHALYGKDPHAIEHLPRSPKTIKAAPGRPPLRSVPKA